MKQFFTLTIALLLGVAAFAQQQWPRVIKGDDGSTISIFEPQPEFMSDNEFTGRAAVSIRKSANEEPVFGAILFTAALKDRRSSRNIELESFRITRVKFAGQEEQADVESFSALIENDALRWDWGMTKEELASEIDREKESASGEGFNNAPPKIIYTNRPSTLVVLDGEPRVLYDKELATDKVVNTPNIIFKEKYKWNLYAGGNWYQSNDIVKGWTINNNLSAKVRSVNEAIKKQERENNEGKELTTKPRSTEVIVTTEPAELIQTDGDPEFKNVSGTSLLYVSNSPNDIFKDINTQKTYIVIAGRWYRAQSLQGPWEYVPSDRLPEDFAKIPEGSDKDAVLANVAGTNAAETALLDAAIPQTARVDRNTATIRVEYDGEPYFVPVKGTSLELAENANVTVILDSDGNYFALDNGIWFISDDPYGPWTVANARPRDLENIPASSPAYHSRYVYIYDVAPDYVYMGYTPGYLGSYVYGPTVVYGTGWHYRPWFRSVYYPRPVTWGFGFMYDPWYGWNFNFGWNWGYTYVGFWYDRPAYWGYGGGWFGPYRHCPAYRRPYWYGGGYYGRGDYYYGRRYDNRNYYGSGTRRDRPYYGTAGNNGRMNRTLGNNLYADQRGVTSRNLDRVARVYRPGDQLGSRSNTTTPVNGRYTNRLSQGSSARPDYNDNRQRVPGLNREGNSRQGSERLERTENPRRPVIRGRETEDRPAGTLPRGNDSRRPQLNVPERNPGNNNEGLNTPNRPGENRRELPQLTSPQRDNNDRPQRVERPAVSERRQQLSGDGTSNESRQIQRPSLERSAPASRPSVERPSYESRPSTPARPSLENRSSSPSRPAFESRPSAPSRPSVESRPSAPSRPSFESRPSAPSSRPSFDRPSSSSGGGSRPANTEQGRRPDRR